MSTSLFPLHQSTHLEDFVGILRPSDGASQTTAVASQSRHCDTVRLSLGFDPEPSSHFNEPIPNFKATEPWPPSTDTAGASQIQVSLNNNSSSTEKPGLLSGSPSSCTDPSLVHTPINPQTKHRRRKIYKPSGTGFSCERGCHSVFASPKDLRRHYNSGTHIESAAKKYRCRCDYSTTRKDHYRRHLRHVSTRRSCNFSRPYFECICKHGNMEDNIQEQIQHINICSEGRGRSGRPSTANGRANRGVDTETEPPHGT